MLALKSITVEKAKLLMTNYDPLQGNAVRVFSTTLFPL
jgi:hypothetical protein